MSKKIQKIKNFQKEEMHGQILWHGTRLPKWVFKQQNFIIYLSMCTEINKFDYDKWISDGFFYQNDDNNEDKKWGQNHDKLNKSI